MAEYVTCPTCGTKSLTADTLIGRYVRCFGCESRFLATPDPPALEPRALEPRDAAPPTVSRDGYDLPPAPPQFAGDEEEDEEDWPFCPGCGRQVTWEDRTCRHCGEEFEEDDRPPVRPLRLDVALPVRRDGEPHRAGLLFALGATSTVAGALSACSFGSLAAISIPLGATVWVLASRDLRRMTDGQIDPRGRDRTRQARSAGVAGIAFGVLFAGIYLLF
jgi:DNA-directed RNA polymerase subunit RPC12/RpoP